MLVCFFLIPKGEEHQISPEHYVMNSFSSAVWWQHQSDNLVEFYLNTNANAAIWLAEWMYTYRPLACSDWWSSTEWYCFILFFQCFGATFWCKWNIKFRRRLKEGYLCFLDFKKLEIIEKNDARVHKNAIINLSMVQSLIIHREIILETYFSEVISVGTLPLASSTITL